ncbi:unnamed protein product [Caenorhabditis bovis]|uniref:Serpentine receptor class r-10 n=1 Tax=Caenorhabditis bovis TaxID=2654633 RepID=A0A8S1EFV5_9PELO|nr:unnamed protein product [Caenorhabditis bovis]
MYSFNSLRILFQYIFGVQSILLNTFLIFLIWNRSPKQIGTYKYMMIYISIFEIFYSIIDVIVEPIVHSYRSTFSALMNIKNSVLGREMNKCLLAMFCGFYGFSLALFGVHFIYRYGSTRRQTRDRYFESRFAIIWFSIPVIACIIWVAVCLLLISEWDGMTTFIRKSVLDDYDLMMEDVVYIGAYFYPIDENGNQYINMKSLYGIIILWTILASSMFCVFYFGIRCYYKISKEMSEIAVMSNYAKKLQEQLFNALVIQTMIPVLLMYFPPMYSFNSLRKFLQYIFGVQSILLNTFLIFLIWNRSPKQLGTYKYMMMYISIFEMIYSIIDIIVEPIVHSYRSTFSALMNIKNSVLGREMNKCLLAIFCGFYSFSLALFGVLFIYRYGSIRRQTRDRYFESRFAIIWFSIPVIVCIIWVAVCLLLICEWDEMTNFIRNSVLNDYDLLMEDVVYIGAYFYPIDENGNQYINMKSLYGIIILWTILASSIFCVFYFGLRCYYNISKEMSEIAVMSNYAKKLQEQLFYALVIQTMIPVILMYFPVTALFLVSFFDTNFVFAARSTPISIAFYPAIDPLPTIFIVKAYQKATFGNSRNGDPFLK